jgi:hypothetical protein
MSVDALEVSCNEVDLSTLYFLAIWYPVTIKCFEQNLALGKIETLPR